MKYTLLKPIERVGKKGSTVFEIPTHEGNYVTQLLLDLGYIEPYEPYDRDAKWEPKNNEDYWTVNTKGEVEDFRNLCQEVTDMHKNALGVYRTFKEAEAARDRIRAFVANGFK